MKKMRMYLKYAQDVINELKRMKIMMLDNEIFPEALAELQKMSQDRQGHDEKLHQEFSEWC